MKLQEHKFYYGKWIVYKDSAINIVRQPQSMDEWQKLLDELHQLYNILVDETGYPGKKYAVDLSNR